MKETDYKPTPAEKYPKCARCLYAMTSVRGKPSCAVRAHKVTKCPTYKKPNSTRLEFQRDGYHFVVYEINYYSAIEEEERYVEMLNVYLEPYNKTKKGKPIYRARSKEPYLEPKGEVKLTKIALESFNMFYLGKIAKA